MMGTWDRDDPDSWIGCPLRGSQWFFGGITAQLFFDQVKSMLETDLENRKHLESQIHGDERIEGIDIEHAIVALGKAVKIPNPMHYYNWASLLDHDLDRRAKQIIYGCLQDYLMNRPRRSIWSRAYHELSWGIISGSRTRLDRQHA
jgi:hypothetical protein